MNVKEKIAKKPSVHYDKKHDILYISTKPGEGEDEFIEIAQGVNVELNAKKEIIGIEIFKASQLLRKL